MSRQYPFIQNISLVDGKGAIMPDHVMRASIIENGDLSGTKLMMSLVDRNAYYRDDLKLGNGVEIEVTYGDPDGRGDDVFIETFVISNAPYIGELIEISAFEKNCLQLKQVSSRTQFFVDQSPASIIRTLAPNVKINADTFDKPGTYHLNPGASPSRLIRNMARDYGAMVFYSRGTLYFKDITNLANQAPVMTFEHKNPQAAINMAKLNIINQSMMYQRTLNREYMQWDTVAGLTKSGKPDNGSVMITSGTAGALDNQNDAIIPMIDCELFGNSSFAPGIVVNVVLHLGIPDKVIDEAVPEVQIINRVTHHQLGSRYLCRVELGVLNK